MSFFKPREKVVYVGNGLKPVFNGFNFPQKHEIVTVNSFCKEYEGSLVIQEYMYDYKGRNQSFKSNNFRKLNHSFADSILKGLKRSNILKNSNYGRNGNANIM